MRKSIWMVLLFGVIMFWAAGLSFAQLRLTVTPQIICNNPCSSDATATRLVVRPAISMYPGTLTVAGANPSNKRAPARQN